MFMARSSFKTTEPTEHVLWVNVLGHFLIGVMGGGGARIIISKIHLNFTKTKRFWGKISQTRDIDGIFLLLYFRNFF